MTRNPQFVDIGVGVFVGAMFWLGVDHFYHGDRSPVSVYSEDLNGDGLKDLVIENTSGDKYVFLQNEDSTFYRLEDLEKAQRDSIDTRMRKVGK